ncbi:unnamed protein product [Enterobius vermicularis]|uniref:Transthyretin-like family protein n=1 Tax=Enterobius vermicularis TaxID=51028 RepID=A0A0N4VIP2_ENTVE|nr:unnamed protein product [Enterobius vermicularis]
MIRYSIMIGLLFSVSTAWTEVVIFEAKGRLLCNGKDHGKQGLAGWPKIVQFWNMETDSPISLAAGFEEVNNRKGIFYVRAVERHGSPVALKILHHCYRSPLKDCYKVDYLPIPSKYENRRFDAGNIELRDSLGTFETRTRDPCIPF